MKKEEIHLGDLNRWLFGQAPPEFMLEVLLRTLIIFLFLLVVIRLMGKRMAGQLTLTEMAVMITLGAIVSPVMQLPDRGILMGVASLVGALLFQRGLNLLGVQNRKAEVATQGAAMILVKDGLLQLNELGAARISKQQLYAMLRKKQIFNMGRVKRAYLEANGLFTVYTSEDETPGLAIFPHTDPEVTKGFGPINRQACCNCGHVQDTRSDSDTCNACGASDWSTAYLSKAS